MGSKTGKLTTAALRALPVAAAAVAVALAVPATPAAAQEAPEHTAPSQAALAPQSGPVGYVFTGYWTWLSDCQARGRDGVLLNEWEGYVCINGSWVPGDDYELWVRHW